VIAFARHALRFLGGVAALPQPRAKGVLIELDAPLLLDEVGQPTCGPQLGGEAVLGGVVGQPAEHDLLLGRGKFAGTTGHGWSGQASGALTPEDPDPTANAAGIDPKEVGNCRDGVALADAHDGEPAAILQDLG